MSQYSSTQWQDMSTDTPFTGWNSWHDIMYILYGVYCIQIRFAQNFPELPYTDVEDITESYVYDFDAKLILGGKERRQVIAEYSRNSGSIILFYKDRIYKIELPPQARKIVCDKSAIRI